MNRAVGFALARVLGLAPAGPIRLAVKAWAIGVSRRRDPARALRALIAIHDDLYWRIDRLAIDYDNGVHVKHRLMRYHDFFVERIAQGERVLDVGCGAGSVAHDVADRAGATVLGIDMNPFALADARERYPHERLAFLEADATTWVPDHPFDVLILSNVLEHIDERVMLLRALIEHAQPSRLLIRVPMSNRHWLVPLRRELGLPYLSDPTHYIEYVPEVFRSEMAEAGLDVAELEIGWGEIWADVRPQR
ncbi:MAG TPA: class I SAM-dependent methyltransferase [Gaiellaceae bacterium]